MAADRIYVEKSTKDEIYDNCKLMGYKTFNKIERKDQFFVALGLGYKFGIRTEIEHKEEMFLTKNLTREENAALYAIAIKEKGSLDKIDNLDEVYTICQEYANTGINYLKKIEKDSSYENYFLKFEKIVNDYIKDMEN